MHEHRLQHLEIKKINRKLMTLLLLKYYGTHNQFVASQVSAPSY